MEKDSRVLPPVPVLPINKETGPFHQGPGSLFPNTPQEGALSKITRVTAATIPGGPHF